MKHGLAWEAAEALGGKRRWSGSGWLVQCPGHDDHEPSLHLSERPAPAGGTRLLVNCFAGCSFERLGPLLRAAGVCLTERAEEAQGPGTNGRRRAEPEEPGPDARWAGPKRPAKVPRLRHHGLGLDPVKVWVYRNEAGAHVGYTARYETEEGRKVVRPWAGWRAAVDTQVRVAMAAPPTGRRWPYASDEIAAHPGRTVVLVEGEKACDAAQVLLPDCVASCWQGGADSAWATRWEGLEGRDVVLVPDMDPGGWRGMAQAWKAVQAAGGRCALAAATDVAGRTGPVPKGWDLADALEEGTTEAEVRRARARLARGHPLRKEEGAR